MLQALEDREGIGVADGNKPDRILLDIQLPSMDGYKVARTLRTNPDLFVVPIVAVTSQAMVWDREKTLNSGCSSFIEKPINPDTFLIQVEQYLLGGAC